MLNFLCFFVLSLNRLPTCIWNSQNCSMFPLAFVAWSLQGHWWGFISRNFVVWPIFFLMNVFIALKGTHFFFIRNHSDIVFFRGAGLTCLPKKSLSGGPTEVRSRLNAARDFHFSSPVQRYMISQPPSSVDVHFQTSHVTRKPVLAIYEQQRRRLACASAQSDQHLCCSLLRYYNT